ncbi:hypothetical protein GLYMA_18G051000v4 [Glycine max]|uniref:Uncharacterized protein n=1 Tax=Glycine max TaxID=3847 RepID=A0A0R0EW34_SOYBN|nr:hypothetical protein GYH30_049083 [Glycine max]KRG98108.1 hypothetical protein GLYMA_18G051000v4 [Glycine max]
MTSYMIKKRVNLPPFSIFQSPWSLKLHLGVIYTYINFKVLLLEEVAVINKLNVNKCDIYIYKNRSL